MAASLDTCRRFKSTGQNLHSGQIDSQLIQGFHKFTLAVVGNKLYCAMQIPHGRYTVLEVEFSSNFWKQVTRLTDAVVHIILIRDKMLFMPEYMYKKLSVHDIPLGYTFDIETKGIYPGRRRDYTAAFMEYTSELFVFGGLVLRAGRTSNDLFVFTPESSRWRSVRNVKGIPPTPRTEASSCVDRDKLFVYGGRNSLRLQVPDLHVLSTSIGYTWSKLCQLSDSPCISRNLLLNCGERLLLFGGTTRVEESMWLYVKSTQELVQLSIGHGDFQVDGNNNQEGFRAAIRRGNEVIILNPSQENTQVALVTISPHPLPG